MVAPSEHFWSNRRRNGAISSIWLGRERVLDRQRIPGLPRALHDAASEFVDHALMRGQEMHHHLRLPLDAIHRII